VYFAASFNLENVGFQFLSLRHPVDIFRKSYFAGGVGALRRNAQVKEATQY
jgi:hypothetical protein